MCDCERESKLDKEVKRLNDKVRTLENRIAFFEALISNPNLPGKCADVLYATVYQVEIEQEKYPDRQSIGGGTRVYRGNVAECSGTSPQTVTDCWKKMHDGYIIAKDTRPIISEHGEIKKETFISVDPCVYDNPAAFHMDRNYGGERDKKVVVVVEAEIPEKPCVSCESEKPPFIQVVATCTTCGDSRNLPYVFTEKERALTEAERKVQYAIEGVISRAKNRSSTRKT